MNKILAIILALLGATILIGTAAVFIKHKGMISMSVRKADPPPQSKMFSNMSSFGGFGQIRTSTMPEKGQKRGVPLVVSAWLSFPKTADNAFSEELAQKSLKIKAVIKEYFSRCTESELLSKGEDAIKKELLHEINSVLVMGEITAVYFSEYIYLE